MRIPLHQLPEPDRQFVGEARKRVAAKRHLNKCGLDRTITVDMSTIALVQLCRMLKPVHPFYQKQINALRDMGFHKNAQQQRDSLLKQGIHTI